jgi:hypothetical protein
VQVLKFLETHSERKAAEDFRISKTCVNNIKKRRAEYLERIEHESDKFCRKIIKAINYDISKATLNWFPKMSALNARISDPVIQEAALRLAKEFGQFSR